MAVKLSSGLWLMNNEIRNIIEDCRREYHLEYNDRKKLGELREEYYKLTEKSTFKKNPTPFIGPNIVLVRGVAEEVEQTDNPERLFHLWEEVADILKKYRIERDVYRRLGEVFDGMKRKPRKDILELIEDSNKQRHLYRLEYFS